MEALIIKNDLFNIANRLKSIDSKYYIIRNNKKNRFEIHYKRSKNTLELVLPYGKLDNRTINYVLKTKMENRKKLINEIESHNKKLEEERDDVIKEKTLFKMEEELRKQELKEKKCR